MAKKKKTDLLVTTQNPASGNWLELFLDFISQLVIDSKEGGVGHLELYGTQRRFLAEIIDGLDRGIHTFICLKAIQLGASTISLAIILFWIAVHPGMQAVLVTDTDGNRQKFRLILKRFIASLPRSYRVGIAKGGDNREHMVLENGSVLDFLVAGTRSSAIEVGRSRAYNVAYLCVAPGTPVIVGHGVIKPIEDVHIGDVVLTHTGQSAKVVDVLGQTNNKGPMIGITPWLGQSILCTDDHTIPTQRGIIHAKDVTLDDFLVMPIRKITGKIKTVTLQETRMGTGSVRNSLGQFTKQSNHMQKGLVRIKAAGSGKLMKLTEEVGYAIGYYLAEGSLKRAWNGNYSTIVFVRHRKEKHYSDRAIAALLPYTTGRVRTYDRNGTLTTTETINCTPLAQWIADNFGGPWGKFIPDDVFEWGEEFCRGLLSGMLCGDGSKKTAYTRKKYATNTVIMPTIHSSLATQARDIAASLGYGWGSIFYKAGGDHYGRMCKPCWRVTWNGSAAFGLRALMGLKEIPRNGHDYTEKYRLVDGLVYLKIRKIKQGIEEPEMWHLSVDHPDHTFRTPHMAIGNTEVANYGAIEGVVSLLERLAEKHPDRLFLLESPLALDTPVPTPSGWTTMGEVKEGDMVFDEKGQPCAVVGTSPVFINRNCYRIDFNTGDSIVSDASHIWRVWERGSGPSRWSAKDLPTSSLDPSKHRIQLANPIQCKHETLPVDPYVLGVWLGDGHTEDVRVTAGEIDINEMRELLRRRAPETRTAKFIRQRGNARQRVLDALRQGTGTLSAKQIFKALGNHCYPTMMRLLKRMTECGLVARESRGHYRATPESEKQYWSVGPVTKYKKRGGGVFGLPGLKNTFNQLGLIGNKHIPRIYLRASEDQRRDLLCGLMDTDGTVQPNGSTCNFTNSNQNIISGVKELLSSLGIKYKESERAAEVKRFANGKDYSCASYTTLSFSELPHRRVFNLARKRVKHESRKKTKWRRSKTATITSISLVPSVPVRCIGVDSPSHLFLVGRSMLPTHNTAKGYNLFWKLWTKARDNIETQKAFFVGWWSKEDYSIQRDDPLFEKYWDGTVDSLEQERINKAWEKYGVRITPEQLVWYRWKYDTSADTSLFDQNFPWDEEDAFIQTGQSFFPVKRLAKLVHDLSNNPPPFKGYAYEFSDTFMDTKVESVNDADQAQLKIYEEPSEMGQYVMGVDPAFGRSANQDRSVVQVCRCYADRLVQVAEFASASPESYQVAWVTAHLAGLYKNVMLIIEISGPGEATVLELKHLRQLFDAGALPTPGNGEITDLFGAARYYMYHRSDSPGAGFQYNWKTGLENKLSIMNQLRDSMTIGMVEVRSIQCAIEIQSLVQDGFTIEPAISTDKDDRVFGLAFAHRAWTDWVRPAMIDAGDTWEKVTKAEAANAEGSHDTIVSHIVSEFFRGKQEEREEAEIDRMWDE